MILRSSVVEDNNQFFKLGRMYRSRDHNFMFLLLKILSKTTWFYHLVVLNQEGKQTIVAHEDYWTELKKEEQK